jgi:hypothetical protein
MRINDTFDANHPSIYFLLTISKRFLRGKGKKSKEEKK